MKKSSPTIPAVDYILRNASEGSRAELDALGHAGNSKRLCHELVQAPFSGVFGIDDTPICYVGVGTVRSDFGLWECTVIPTDQLPRIILPLTRFVKNSLMPFVKNKGARRVQGLSLATNTTTHKWFDVVGFEFESELPRYGRAGEAFHLYRWLP